MKPDDELCYCFHISKRKILNYLRIHQPRRPSQLSDCGGAGTGCGWCVPYLKKCFQNHQAGTAVSEDSQSAAEYAAGRAAYLKAGKGIARPGTEPRQEDSEISGSSPSQDLS